MKLERNMKQKKRWLVKPDFMLVNIRWIVSTIIVQTIVFIVKWNRMEKFQDILMIQK